MFQDVNKHITVMVGLVTLICSFTPCQALTTSQWVDKAQGWVDDRDNGAFTADITVQVTDSDQSQESHSGEIWFEDDTVDGWSLRHDMTLDYGSCGTVVCKKLTTPDGRQEFLGSTCVYNSEDVYLVDTWACQPHSSLPKCFYAGDPNQTPLQALNTRSTSTSASETTLDSNSVYKLDVTWDVDEINSLIAAPSDYLESTDSVTSVFYVKSSDGEPVRQVHTFQRGNYTYESRMDWSNVNTNPSIPSGTFSLTQDSPTATFEEALADWLEQNCL